MTSDTETTTEAERKFVDVVRLRLPLSPKGLKALCAGAEQMYGTTLYTSDHTDPDGSRWLCFSAPKEAIADGGFDTIADFDPVRRVFPPAGELVRGETTGG